MHYSFEYITALQYREKTLSRQVDEFRSGEKYTKMKEEHQKEIREKDRLINNLKKELEQARKDIVTIRKYWEEVQDDVDREHAREIRQMMKKLEQMEKRALKAEQERDEMKDKYRKKNLELYAVQTELEEERGKNQKLTAQINKDFENSSLPSSLQGPERKKIPNSRQKTGRKQGGQPGHKGHKRKRLEPTETHEIPVPPKYAEDPDYYETGKIIRKQKIVMEMQVKVIEYTTKELRNRKTQTRVHAPFPEGYTNEVNYDGTVKAFAFLLGNECNVSHDKIRTFVSEITDGKIRISKGMINGLCQEFSGKTKKEQKEIYKRLMTSPVMNVDFTNANVNGESAQVLILASPLTDAAMFIARETKGHKGIKDTPLEEYAGIIIHDHDTTFYRYGTGHQECAQHNCRYLIGSIENEPDRTWNTQMHKLFQEMLHYRNSLGEAELDAATVAGFEERYDKILNKAEEEYEYEPPGNYYREGYNLFLRLRKYKESELRFLHDKKVPANNSLCERLARVYKRKQKQATVMRSQDNLQYLCNSMSTVYMLRCSEENTYERIAEIFRRKRPPKPKKETEVST